jgi:uncharacterized protein YneF (UPF0154 family)
MTHAPPEIIAFVAPVLIALALIVGVAIGVWCVTEERDE